MFFSEKIFSDTHHIYFFSWFLHFFSLSNYVGCRIQTVAMLNYIQIIGSEKYSHVWCERRKYISCCSCSFEPEIVKIGQSSHKIYSNNILNFQKSTTILNASTKKSGNLLKVPRILPFLILTSSKCFSSKVRRP